MVTATGMHTYFGRPRSWSAPPRRVSHFQKAVLTIGDYLIYLSPGSGGRADPGAVCTGTSRLLELFQFALILTVAAIPVALPAVLSVTMAIGAAGALAHEGHRLAPGVHRGDGRHRCALLGQDRHPDREPPHRRGARLASGVDKRRS